MKSGYSSPRAAAHGSRTAFLGAVLILLLPCAEAGSPSVDDAAIRSLEIRPGTIDLAGPLASQRLVVLGVAEDGRQVDLTRLARVTSVDPAVVSAGEIDGEG